MGWGGKGKGKGYWGGKGYTPYAPPPGLSQADLTEVATQIVGAISGASEAVRMSQLPQVLLAHGLDLKEWMKKGRWQKQIQVVKAAAETGLFDMLDDPCAAGSVMVMPKGGVGVAGRIAEQASGPPAPERRVGEADVEFAARMAEWREACQTAKAAAAAAGSSALTGTAHSRSKQKDAGQWKQKLADANLRRVRGLREGLPIDELRELGEKIAEVAAEAAQGKFAAGIPMGNLPALLQAKKGIALKEMKDRGNYFSQRRLIEATRGASDAFLTPADPKSPTGDILIAPLSSKEAVVLAEGAATGAARPVAAPVAAGFVLCCIPGCGQHPKGQFSATQLGRKAGERKCNACVGQPGRQAELKATSAALSNLLAGGSATSVPGAPPAAAAVVAPAGAPVAAAAVPAPAPMPRWATPGVAAEAEWDGGWLACMVVETPADQVARGLIRIQWAEDSSMSDMEPAAIRPAAAAAAAVAAGAAQTRPVVVPRYK